MSRLKTLPWLSPVLALIIASVLLFYRLDSTVGIHRDEAAFGLLAEKILKGFRPMQGYFNTYTSPLHSYLIAASFRVLGESIWTLRLSGVLFNLGAAVLYWDSVRRLDPDLAGNSLWLLVSLPAFVVFSRISGENYALNPFFICSGTWLFLVARGLSPGVLSIAGFIFSGLLFFLGCCNHLVFVPTFLALAVVYLFTERRLAWKLTIGVAAPVIVLVSRWKSDSYFFEHARTQFESDPHGKAAIGNALANLYATVGGDAMFARATGRVIFPLSPVIPITLGGVLIFAFFKNKSWKHRRFFLCTLACFFLSFIGGWLITPVAIMGARIWLLTAWLVPLALALALSGLKPQSQKIVVAFVVTANLVAISTNYFYSFAATGGIPTRGISEGGSINNTVDFMDTHSLVEKLASMPVGRIYIEDRNTDRLLFQLPEAARSRVWPLNLQFTGQIFPAGSILIYMRLIERDPCPDEMPGLGARAVRRDELSTPQFCTYVL